MLSFCKWNTLTFIMFIFLAAFNIFCIRKFKSVTSSVSLVWWFDIEYFQVISLELFDFPKEGLDGSIKNVRRKTINPSNSCRFVSFKYSVHSFFEYKSFSITHNVCNNGMYEYGMHLCMISYRRKSLTWFIIPNVLTKS